MSSVLSVLLDPKGLTPLSAVETGEKSPPRVLVLRTFLFFFSFFACGISWRMRQGKGKGEKRAARAPSAHSIRGENGGFGSHCIVQTSSGENL